MGRKPPAVAIYLSASCVNKLGLAAPRSFARGSALFCKPCAVISLPLHNYHLLWYVR